MLITTSAVAQALSQFIGLFGISKILQTGLHFSSHQFVAILKQLKCHQSSAYHAQSQGALEQTERRTFLPGDQVFVLLPVTGSPFKARCCGPHTVTEKLSDQNDIIATPGRRTGKHLSHVNLLKPYFFHAEVGGGQEAGTPGASSACVTMSGFSHIGTEWMVEEF